MIGYLDQTWCIHSSRAQREKRCMTEACPRNITDAHFERAEKSGLPIFSLADKRTDDCGYTVEVDMHSTAATSASKATVVSLAPDFKIEIGKHKPKGSADHG